MTTEQLRKVVKVTDWNLNETGLIISYEREDHTPKLLHLILSPDETLMALSKVGSVDDYLLADNNNVNSLAEVNEIWYTFKHLVTFYVMCQWEALSIAIRHEAERELVKDTNMLEIDNMLDALK
jgi:hypothetical protein